MAQRAVNAPKVCRSRRSGAETTSITQVELAHRVSGRIPAADGGDDLPGARCYGDSLRKRRVGTGAPMLSRQPRRSRKQRKGKQPGRRPPAQHGSPSRRPGRLPFGELLTRPRQPPTMVSNSQPRRLHAADHSRQRVAKGCGWRVSIWFFSVEGVTKTDRHLLQMRHEPDPTGTASHLLDLYGRCAYCPAARDGNVSNKQAGNLPPVALDP
jgi:hypothetical protein